MADLPDAEEVATEDEYLSEETPQYRVGTGTSQLSPRRHGDRYPEPTTDTETTLHSSPNSEDTKSYYSESSFVHTSARSGYSSYKSDQSFVSESEYYTNRSNSASHSSTSYLSDGYEGDTSEFLHTSGSSTGFESPSGITEYDFINCDKYFKGKIELLKQHIGQSEIRRQSKAHSVSREYEEFIEQKVRALQNITNQQDAKNLSGRKLNSQDTSSNHHNAVTVPTTIIDRLKFLTFEANLHKELEPVRELLVPAVSPTKVFISKKTQLLRRKHAAEQHCYADITWHPPTDPEFCTDTNVP